MVSPALVLFYAIHCVFAQVNLPDVAPGVFEVSAATVINAPIEKVWKTLIDVAKYPEWNPFVRSQIVTSKFLVPTAEQTLQEGLRLFMVVQLPPLEIPVDKNTPSKMLNTQVSLENITTVDPINHRVAWRALMLPEQLLDAERWQGLSVVAGGGTLYETREVFRGVISYAVKGLYADKLEEGFRAQTRALKARVEE